MTFADDWTLNNFPAFSFISSHDHFSVILTFRSYIQGMFNEMHKLLSMASVVTQRLTKRSSKYPHMPKSFTMPHYNFFTTTSKIFTVRPPECFRFTLTDRGKSRKDYNLACHVSKISSSLR